MTRPSAPHTRPAAQRRPGGGPGGSSWRAPLALIALSLIPLTAGSLRLLEITGGPQLLPTNPRVDASPAPVVIHILAATVYALLGALQFPGRFRRRHPGWHRTSGRVLTGAGLLVASSGLWMTLFYPGAPGGDLLWGIRLLVGSAMAASIVAGFTAIRRRDITAHRAWMTRAYALALGAGTQVVTQGTGEALFGAGDLSTAISVGSGWVINAVVAEWVIRRPRSHRTGSAGSTTSVESP
ncbi:DUF2306 domain-containing protein [Virgisporangium ochraceum]|uniref:Membrane protein n=1 Tax=Virgisporangium ochraceum TaxID=65505 RepID=A0A8J4A3N6_9ACTN|nr:DUF2306 domain-containing protein [Virgisporangium ochraceum]GIJ75269.1 membrane protein [Virgisporangium ochraceum]